MSKKLLYIEFQAFCFCEALNLQILVNFLYTVLYRLGNYQHTVGTTIIIDESVKIIEDTSVEVAQPIEQEFLTG